MTKAAPPEVAAAAPPQRAATGEGAQPEVAAGKLWWLAGLVICLVGFELSFYQVSEASARDIRLEAMAAVFDGQRTYVGDPWPSVEAAAKLARRPGARLYDADLAVGSAFIYPPLAAALYRPLVELPPVQARRRLMLVNHLLFLGVLLLLLRLVAAGGHLAWREVAGTLGVMAIFYPLLHALELNQAMVLVTVLLGGAFVALQARREGLAGVLLACAFVLKPQLVLVLPLLVFHARTMVWWALGASGILAGLSLLYGGLANHTEYLTRVLPTLSRGYGYYANHSWNGVWNRLLVGGDIGVFAMPPASTAVRALTVASGLLCYGAAGWLVWRWRRERGLALWVLAFGWIVTTFVSPIAWQHHYAPALFALALLYRHLRDDPTYRRWGFVAGLSLSFTLLGVYFEVRQLQGAVPRLAVSYLFYGGLGLAILIGAVLESEGRRLRASSGIA